MQLVKLQRCGPDGEPGDALWVNPEHVCSVRPEAGQTFIQVGTGAGYYRVLGTPEEVIDRLQGVL